MRNRNILSKRWTSAVGIDHGGVPITRGALYAVLTNPIYRGMTRQGKTHLGQHPAVNDQETWEKAQALMTKSVSARRMAKTPNLKLGAEIWRE